MKRMWLGSLLILSAGSVWAQFYPLSPATYRMYYADSVRNHIRTCTISFSPLNDVPWITGDELLYAANSPRALAVCGDDLYWIEGGTSLYRGRKDVTTSKTLLRVGLGGFTDDMIIRGGAIYITDAQLSGSGYGTLILDLTGTTIGGVKMGDEFQSGIERVAMNYLVRNDQNGVNSYAFNTGATQLLTTVGAWAGFDLAVADTSLVWNSSASGLFRIEKKPLGGGATALLYSGPGDEARYMDTLDNRVFSGFISGGNSYLAVVGVRGEVAGRGVARNVLITAGVGLRGIAIEKLNQVKNDFDGDGVADRCVYHPTTGQWYIFGTATGFYTDQFGYAGTIPVPGDYDGDGLSDYGVFDPAAGTWYLFRSSLGFYTTTFGGPGMMPCISDYDNDGRSDLCLFNPPDGRWHIMGSTRGYFPDQFGNAQMIPVDTQTRTQP